MNGMTRWSVVGLALSLVVIVSGGAAVRAAITVVPPESVGFSSQGLRAYADELSSLVAQGRLAGVSTLVARHGKVVMYDAFGYRDLETHAPLQKDTIFRIASMTKPIAGVAMMMLWEEGKWSLDDPVAKHIPEFKDLKVTSPNGPVSQSHPMTMRELMSHTAGFDVSAGYEGKNINDRSKPLQAMIDALAQLPLAAQPGTDWRYGPSVDIQGYVVEKLSGQPLDEFLRTRIFEPLKMVDSGFSVEKSKLARVAKVNTYNEQKKIITAPTQTDPSRKPVFLSGSGGLLSTLEDYYHFSQMLLNGGEYEGKRLVKASTIELMRTNVLKDGVMVDLYGPREPGIGFGLDFAIVLDPAKANTPRGKNTFYWGGAFGTWFWVDPTNDVVVVGMIQNLRGSVPTGDTPQLRPLSSKLVYAALTKRATN
jgi:CubicO group peptidase (beta-lactamase class C family)